MISLPVVRTEGGCKRSVCACEVCSCYCKVMPGYLVPSDLERLIPPGVDPLQWARQHLRASQGAKAVDPKTGEVLFIIPSLVPAKQALGHCHWLQPDGKCGVHADSPFGCAFFDQHMTDEEAERRKQYARMVRAAAFEDDSLYATIWHTLKAEGLVGGGEYAQAQAYRRQVERRLAQRREDKARKQRRLKRKKRRHA
jgi:hypothetical protein